MVVKSATKKKLMDLQIDEEYAHKLADDRKWDDVKMILLKGEVLQLQARIAELMKEVAIDDGHLCKSE